MALTFEWDAAKASSNLEKHGVSFQEASTVFGDALSLTINDPFHSVEESHFVTIGESAEREVWSSFIPTEKRRFASSARVRPRVGSAKPMKPDESNEEMLSHYDFSGGVRGQFAEPYARGTNVVLLAPDVAAAFPTAEAVNEALRSLIRIETQQTPAQK